MRPAAEQRLVERILLVVEFIDAQGPGKAVPLAEPVGQIDSLAAG
jgi:hypothetical protein